jgi:ferredoxin
MKVQVDWDRCETNALCVLALPEVFEVRDDDLLHVLTDAVPAGREAAAERAVVVCPRQAITLQS